MLRGYIPRLIFKGVALGEDPYTSLQCLEDYGLPNEATIVIFQVKTDKARDYSESLFKTVN